MSTEVEMEMVYMKARDVMNRYQISRNTLSNWVKAGKIKYDVTPTGRYIYLVERPKNTDGN